MCGLSGVYKPTYLSSQERKAFIDLGSISFFRGTDSTGVGVVTRKKPASPKFNSTIIKGIDHAVDFYRRKDVLSEIHNNKAMCLIGHARAATHGLVNPTNAQPVREGSIIGTHNGVVRKFEPEKNELADYTDSRKLFRAFDRGVVKYVLDSLYMNDAYALVWMDSEYNTLNFVRNDKRPLYLCKSKSGALFWSSDPQMIIFCLGRNDVEYDDIKPMPENTLLSIDMLNGIPTTEVLKKESVISFTSRPGMGPSTPITYTAGGVFKPTVGTGARAASIFQNREEVKDELVSTSMQSMDSHKDMVAFMQSTTAAYVRGGSGLIDDDNVIPFTQKQNDDWVKGEVSKVSDKKINEFFEGLEKKEVDEESSYPFLKRPEASLIHSPYAEYKMRRHGIPQWVSVTVAENYLNRGCMCCGETASILDTVQWKDPSNYLCATCSNDENLKDFYKYNSDWVQSELDENKNHVYSSVYGG